MRPAVPANLVRMAHPHTHQHLTHISTLELARHLRFFAPDNTAMLLVTLLSLLLCAGRSTAAPTWPSMTHDVYNTRFTPAPAAPSASFVRNFNVSFDKQGPEFLTIVPTSQGTLVALLSNMSATSGRAIGSLVVQALDGSTGSTLWTTTLQDMTMQSIYDIQALVDSQDRIIVVCGKLTSNGFAAPAVFVLDSVHGTVLDEVGFN